MSSTLEDKKIQRIFYVYVHKRKTDNTIFYVGKGTGNRSFSDESRNVWWSRIVKKSNGFIPEIIYFDLTEQESFKKERELILSIGLANLCNITEGGCGGDTLTRNPNILEIGKKISNKCIGDLNPNKGMGYYKRWILKYGLIEANRMKEELKQKRKALPKRKNINRVYKPWKQTLQEKYGDKWEEKYSEINNVIRLKYFERPKISCENCGNPFHKNVIKRHQNSLKCIKINNV